jgi:hypothetical protein
MNEENGCQGATIPVNVIVESCAGIPELQQFIESITLSPNPTNGEFSISFFSSQFEKISLNMIDLNGKKVWSNEIDITLGKNSIPSIVIRSPEKILKLEEIKKKYEKKKESQEYKNAVEEEKIIKLQVVNTLTNFKNQVLA